MTALDESLDTMLQHARVALGPRKHRPTTNAAGSARPTRRALMAPAAEVEEDNRMVEALLNVTDVDRWIAGGQHARASRHVSPPRSVVPGVEGHDRRHNPTLSRPHTPQEGLRQSPSRSHPKPTGNNAAVYRQGTTEDVLASIVVRGEHDPAYRTMAQYQEPIHTSIFAAPSPSPRRGQLGPSVGDRVSGYYSERVGAAAWGSNGDLAIGFDDNDDPVVVVRPHPVLVHDAVLQPATSSANSKVASVQSQCLDPILDAATVTGRSVLKSPAGSVSSQALYQSKPLPIPSPDAATSFKDVHHRFINPSAAFSSPTNPPPPPPIALSINSEVMEVPLAVEARDTVLPAAASVQTTPLDATRGPQPTEFLLEEPKDRRPSSSTAAAAAAGVASEPINAASALQHRARSPSPREDHGTQTEQHQQSGQQQSTQSTIVPPNATTTTSSAWALASTEAFLEKTPLTPPQHHHHSHQVLARPRPLPMFTIPTHDDEIQFAGPPQIQQWADDRDPAFVSAIVTHRPGAHRDVIPQAEFRKMIVSGSSSSVPQSQDASRPLDSNASKQQNDPLTAGAPTLPQQPLIPIASRW
jgi:hypothetical protein